MRLMALSLLLGASLANAADLDSTFFGLNFGVEFKAPQCEMKGAFALPPSNGYCFEPMKLVITELKGATGNALVKFPPGDLPYWTGGQFVIELIDGRLEGISMGTAGIGSRPLIVEALIKKYGSPHVLTPMPMENAFGSQFDGSIPQWSDGHLTITYTPIRGNIKQGLLQIFTPAGSEAFDRRMKDIMKNLEPKRSM